MAGVRMRGAVAEFSGRRPIQFYREGDDGSRKVSPALHAALPKTPEGLIRREPVGPAAGGWRSTRFLITLN